MSHMGSMEEKGRTSLGTSCIVSLDYMSIGDVGSTICMGSNSSTYTPYNEKRSRHASREYGGPALWLYEYAGLAVR